MNIDLNKTVQVVGETYAGAVTTGFAMVSALVGKEFPDRR